VNLFGIAYRRSLLQNEAVHKPLLFDFCRDWFLFAHFCPLNRKNLRRKSSANVAYLLAEREWMPLQSVPLKAHGMDDVRRRQGAIERLLAATLCRACPARRIHSLSAVLNVGAVEPSPLRNGSKPSQRIASSSLLLGAIRFNRCGRDSPLPVFPCFHYTQLSGVSQHDCERARDIENICNFLDG
jgi:hypothetical protein